MSSLLLLLLVLLLFVVVVHVALAVVVVVVLVVVVLLFVCFAAAVVVGGVVVAVADARLVGGGVESYYICINDCAGWCAPSLCPRCGCHVCRLSLQNILKVLTHPNEQVFVADLPSQELTNSASNPWSARQHQNVEIPLVVYARLAPRRLAGDLCSQRAGSMSMQFQTNLCMTASAQCGPNTMRDQTIRNVTDFKPDFGMWMLLACM